MPDELDLEAIPVLDEEPNEAPRDDGDNLTHIHPAGDPVSYCGRRDARPTTPLPADWRTNGTLYCPHCARVAGLIERARGW